jgi:hypothetical protein
MWWIRLKNFLHKYCVVLGYLSMLYQLKGFYIWPMMNSERFQSSRDLVKAPISQRNSERPWLSSDSSLIFRPYNTRIITHQLTNSVWSWKRAFCNYSFQTTYSPWLSWRLFSVCRKELRLLRRRPLERLELWRRDRDSWWNRFRVDCCDTGVCCDWKSISERITWSSVSRSCRGDVPVLTLLSRLLLPLPSPNTLLIWKCT